MSYVASIVDGAYKMVTTNKEPSNDKFTIRYDGANITVYDSLNYFAGGPYPLINNNPIEAVIYLSDGASIQNLRFGLAPSSIFSKPRFDTLLGGNKKAKKKKGKKKNSKGIKKAKKSRRSKVNG